MQYRIGTTHFGNLVKYLNIIKLNYFIVSQNRNTVERRRKKNITLRIKLKFAKEFLLKIVAATLFSFFFGFFVNIYHKRLYRFITLVGFWIGFLLHVCTCQPIAVFTNYNNRNK